MGLVQIIDPDTQETTIIDLRDDDERMPRTMADVLAQELDPVDDDDIIEVEFEEGEEEAPVQVVGEPEQTGMRYVGICIDSACVTHDMDFSEDDDIRESIRDWTNDQPNRISLIWERPSKEQPWLLIETMTSTATGTDADDVVE